MKERIMLQRAVVAACLLVMLICVGFTGFAWVQMNRARAAAEVDRARAAVEAALASRRMVEAFAESQATNKDLLSQIREVSETLRNRRSTDWNPLRLKLSQRSADGPPVAGATVYLKRLGEDPGTKITRTSDASGIADFGLVQPGNYRCQLRISWDGGWENGLVQINVQPGSELLKTVICPTTPPDRAPVAVRCQWPPDLEAQNVVLYAEFVHHGWELEPGVTWEPVVVESPELQAPGAGAAQTARQSGSAGMSQSWGGSPARAFLCGPARERLWTKETRGVYVWALWQFSSGDEMQQLVAHGRGVRADILESDLDTGPDTKQMEVGSYAQTRLLVLRPTRSQDVRRRRYEVLVACLPNGTSQEIAFLDQPPINQLDSVFRITSGRTLWGASHATPTPKALELPADYWKKAFFEAQPGRPSEWTIPLPDELLKAVRVRLSEDSASQSKSETAKPQSKP